MSCNECHSTTLVNAIIRIHIESAYGPPSDCLPGLEEKLRKTEEENTRLETQLAELRAELEELTQTVNNDIVELKEIIEVNDTIIDAYYYRRR
ncbi:hypothetical protein FRC11_012143 [Ceratobasidium sp. 423]|nr:hypothetical protein FRC11_012143 [Ceratobasidium sp. 423]